MNCPSCRNRPLLQFINAPNASDDEDGFLRIFSLTLTSDDPSTFEILTKGKDEDELVVKIQVGLNVLAQGPVNRVDPRIILWFANCQESDVSDPCLVNAAARDANFNVSQVSCIIGHVAAYFALQSDQYSCCRHGVILNDRICTTLVATLASWNQVDDTDTTIATEGAVGLYNIVDLTSSLTLSRLETVQYVPEAFFEVAAEEEAMSVESFFKMEDWTTRSVCGQEKPDDNTPQIEKRKWGHMLFLSHAWTSRGVPGTREELKSLQSAVKTYIESVLHKGATNTVKNIQSEEDFGVWIDFCIIPNNPKHTKSCIVCSEYRRFCIAKMTALPSVSTTIALNPDKTRKGWILYELSNNTHGNLVDTDGNELVSSKRLEYSHRINLMADRRVSFTNKSDGVELRCHEFIRLGQFPRCWPSVNRVLLEEWAESGITDERSVEAKDILFQYARTFHYDCQGLKRSMVTLPQVLARCNVPVNNDTDTDWVKIPPPKTNPAYDNIENQPQPTVTMPFDFESIAAEIRKQKEDMRLLNLQEPLCEAAEVLQRLQFINVVMGLRAELLHGAGLFHWVTLSSVVQALTTAKRSVRLQEGEHRVHKASCTVSLSPVEWPSEDELVLPEFTFDMMQNGISKLALSSALGMLFGELTSRFEMQQRHQSGRTAAWSDEQLYDDES